jgi:hypothetical protein
LTANASYKLKFGLPRTQAKLIVHQGAVKSAVETLRAKIAWQIKQMRKKERKKEKGLQIEKLAAAIKHLK